MAPLNKYVEKLRTSRPNPRDVPWFDPDSGGVNARGLLLFQAPGRKAIESGFVSPDNDDPSAANLFRLLEEAELHRKELAIWNVVPWYLGSKTAVAPATRADIREAAPHLVEVLKLLPNLKVIVPGGGHALLAWNRFVLMNPRYMLEMPRPPVTLPMAHTSPKSFNLNPDARGQALESLKVAAVLLKRP